MGEKSKEENKQKKKKQKIKIDEIKEIGLKFLATNRNSVFREEIFKNKFKYDFQLACIHQDEHLYIYERDIDKDSVDIILEFKNSIKPIQLKTTIRSKSYKASTSGWKISKKFLKPLFNELNSYSFGEHERELSLGPDYDFVGLGGAVILQVIDYDAKDNVSVKYLYFDFSILDLELDDDVVTSFYKPDKRKRLIELRKKILSGGNKVKISFSDFVNFDNDLERHLGAMGFKTGQAEYGLMYNLKKLRSPKSELEDRKYAIETLARIYSGENIKYSETLKLWKTK